MSKHLWPRLRLGDGEAPLSYLSRLAHLHGSTPSELCVDYDLAQKGIADGDPTALKSFAAVAQSDPHHLIGAAPKRLSNRHWTYKGQTIGQRHLNRARIWVCPSCVAEDVAAVPCPRFGEVATFLRTDWCLVPLRRCRRHRVPLVAIDEEGEDHLDAAAVLERFVASPERLGSAPSDAKSSPYCDYLADRLEGRRGGGWLDRLTWTAVVDACETVGVVATLGPRVAMRSLEEDGRRAAGAAGFAILRDGAPAIRAFLDRMDRSYGQSGGRNDGPQARYGALHRRLAILPPGHELLVLRDIVSAHIVETTPVGPGDEVFRVPVEKRVLHSVQTASREFSIHPKRLRKILVSKGILGPGVDSRMDERSTFRADAAADLLGKMHASMSLTEAETYLNAGRVHARLLMIEGFITPFATHTEVRGADKNFAKVDLDAFLARLSIDAVPVAGAPEGAFGIAAAAKRANCGAGEIVRFILARDLAWVGALRGMSGYGAILVDVEEIRAKVRGAPLEGLTLRQVEQSLRTTTKVVAALIASGFLKCGRVVNPINRCPTRVVREEELARFRGEYVSLFELTEAHGRHPSQITRALDGLGIAPALTREAAGTLFYRRSAVRHLVMPPR